MPSTAYQSLFQTVKAYLPADKAEGLLSRQLGRCNATPDSLTAADLKAVLPTVIGAATLYIPEESRRQEFTAKMKALG